MSENHIKKHRDKIIKDYNLIPQKPNLLKKSIDQFGSLDFRCENLQNTKVCKKKRSIACV